MSLHPTPFGPVPPDTARVAGAAFPNGNLYMRMRDELGQLYTDEQFAILFPRRGQPAEPDRRELRNTRQLRGPAGVVMRRFGGCNPRPDRACRRP